MKYIKVRDNNPRIWIRVILTIQENMLTGEIIILQKKIGTVIRNELYMKL